MGAAARALTALHERGGHFVLCRGKKPLWRAWQRRRPGLDVVLAHGRDGDLGLIPWSLGTSALDVDHGDIGELVLATGPLTTLESPRGHHPYYQDDRPRGNASWAAHGCRGEVRSAKGFLRLYEGGAERLAHALAITKDGTAPFPADLFAAAGVDVPRSLPVEGPRVFRVRAPADLPALEDVQVGGRNVALFNHLRFWAYAQNKGTDLYRWRDRARRIALDMNARFPQPLPEDEVFKAAWSVASWTWSGGGPMDHSPAAQSRRGIRSGVSRRSATWDRDVAIVAAVRCGATMRAVAREHGLSVGGVHYIVARDAPELLSGVQ